MDDLRLFETITEYFTDEKSNGCHMSVLRIHGDTVCSCKVSIDNNIWSIVSWYTEKEHLHNGYGYKTMRHIILRLYEAYGEPDKIRYVWNGANEYVMEWMNRHFSPVSMLPLVVQKYSDKDDWESHIYILDKDKFLKYFDIL